MRGQTEVELKFLVPQESRSAIATEMARKSASLERRTLAALYLDTVDRRLARAGIAWRVRREGRRWIQTLKARGAGTLERFEHEVARPGPSHDAAAHAGTRTGDKLIRILRDARAEGLEVGVRYRTEVRRIARRIHTRGAVVEVAFDEGRLLSNGAKLRLREVEFELVSGSAVAMLTLAERWRKRFGLIYDPRSKAERGDRLAKGSAFAPVRKARALEYSRDAGDLAAFGAILDECLEHISRNSIGLIDGDPGSRVEHVHQLRVGIRRLRSALRSFEGWVPPAPQPLVDALRTLFAELGRARDSDVLDSGVVSALEKVGAPRLVLPDGKAGPDPVGMVRAPGTQQLLLAWLAWRAGLAETTPGSPEPAAAGLSGGDGAAAANRNDAQQGDAGGVVHEPGQRAQTAAIVQVTESEPRDELVPAMGEQHANSELAEERRSNGKAFHREAVRRLRRWHRRIVADSDTFDELDEEGLHALRKRIKRQRYAVEFFAPILRRRAMERYLKPLTTIQDRAGELNDLFVARARYQEVVDSDLTAWFALGWLAARVAEVRLLAKSELKLLAKVDPPGG